MFTYNIHPDYITRSYKNHRNQGYTDIEIKRIKKESIQNLQKGFTQGKELSKISIKKIINAVRWLEIFTNKKVYVTKNGKKLYHKLTFITLTLPSKQMHNDKVIVKEILQRWLDNVRTNYGLRNYIYRAETQSNSNIHFHIITDCNLNYYQILHTWNKALRKLGYIDRFKEINGHENPNSVDVKRLSNSKKISTYIAKYLTKSNDQKEERRTVNCRHYAMSRELSRIKDFNRDSKELAEFAFETARILPNTEEKKLDWSTYIAIDIKRIMAIFKEFKTEIIKQFIKSTHFKASRTYIYAKYQPNQNKLIFVN